MTGKRFAHYEITSQLGKNGMDVVYQAKDLLIGLEELRQCVPVK